MNINTTNLRSLGSLAGIALLTLTLGLSSGLAQTKEFRYRYVSLDQAQLPPGFNLFQPIAINDSGLIYGVAFDESSTQYVAVYKRGVVTILSAGLPNAVNEGGTVGGFVLDDLVNFTRQAALFRGNKVKLIPRQSSEEVSSTVDDLNDSGAALVTTRDNSYNFTSLLYKKSQATPLDFGPTITSPFFLHINNETTISGTTSASGNFRGFRFDTRTSKTTQLNPLSTDTDSRAWDINNNGKVLGDSFKEGIQRIGVWDSKGKFNTYFVEGTLEFPTISNSLVFNDKNLIVITFVTSPVSEEGASYLVPKPGVRLNLAGLVKNMPPDQNLFTILDINNKGDMVGLSVKDFTIQDAFLLERYDEKEHAYSASSFVDVQVPSGMSNRRRHISPAVEAKLRKYIHQLKSDSAMPQDIQESLMWK
jgi:hypothetical protein